VPPSSEPAAGESGASGDALATAALGGGLALWATAFPTISIALEGVGPLPLAAARLAIATFVFALLTIIVRPRLPHGRALVRAVIAGLLLLGGYSVALNLGETRVSPALAGLLISTAPVSTLTASVIGPAHAGCSRSAGCCSARCSVLSVTASVSSTRSASSPCWPRPLARWPARSCSVRWPPSSRRWR